MDNTGIRLCEPAHAFDHAVLQLYEGAFPAGEREPVERLSKLLADGKLLYHRTLNEQGELLCFTFVSLAEDFSFLAYMATDPARRSGGIGSRHLKRLVELLKERFPQHIGMFFEIEATNPKAELISDEQRVNRLRRRGFYERAGARVLCEKGVYLTPHYSERNQEWEGELLAFEFNEPVCQDKLTHVISQIYERFYLLPKDHPLVVKVLGHFDGCAVGCNVDVHSDETEPAETQNGNQSSDSNECSRLPLWKRVWNWFVNLLLGK